MVELTAEQKKTFDLQSGVVIKEVQDGPAALIGLQPGDVITHLNNQAIDTTKEFADIAKALPKNRSVSMREDNGKLLPARRLAKSNCWMACWKSPTNAKYSARA